MSLFTYYIYQVQAGRKGDTWPEQGQLYDDLSAIIA